MVTNLMNERVRMKELSAGQKLLFGLGCVAIFAGIGAGAYAAFGHFSGSSPTFTLPEGDSLSPFAVETFSGTPGASSNPDTWTEGITVTDHTPGQELLFAFTTPGNKEWQKVSVVTPNLSRYVSLEIGNKNVEFGVAVISKVGSASLISEPLVSFSHEMTLANLPGVPANNWKVPNHPISVL